MSFHGNRFISDRNLTLQIGDPSLLISSFGNLSISHTLSNIAEPSVPVETLLVDQGIHIIYFVVNIKILLKNSRVPFASNYYRIRSNVKTAIFFATLVFLNTLNAIPNALIADAA